MLLNPWATSRNVIYSVFNHKINLFKDILTKIHHSVYFPEQQKVSKATWRLLLLWNVNQLLLSSKREGCIPRLSVFYTTFTNFGGTKWKHTTDFLMLLCQSLGLKRKSLLSGERPLTFGLLQGILEKLAVTILSCFVMKTLHVFCFHDYSPNNITTNSRYDTLRIFVIRLKIGLNYLP